MYSCKTHGEGGGLNALSRCAGLHIKHSYSKFGGGGIIL
jgi:hypothetical protein